MASAGLEESVKFYHSSIDLLVLDGFGGATILVYLNVVMSYFRLKVIG